MSNFQGRNVAPALSKRNIHVQKANTKTDKVITKWHFDALAPQKPDTHLYGLLLLDKF